MYQFGYATLSPDMYAHRVLTMTEAFAQIIREEKKRTGMTWDQIAARSGLSIITVKRIADRAGTARKPAPPNVEELAALARAFDANGHGWFLDAERRVNASHNGG